jgi:predicted O-methyltransferase YrrM
LPDFHEIRRACHGMLTAELYERLYETARAAGEGAYVEIGTGHGAGAVCMALALRDSGREGRVYTFDKFEGGSRKHYGDAVRNLEITREAVGRFGVADLIEIVPGDAGETIKALPDSPVAMLFIDCDGRLDRDFANVLDRVPLGAPVVLDDIANRARASNKGTHLRIDQKHRIAWLLTRSARDCGLLGPGRMVRETWFGTRGPEPVSAWPAGAVIECYRQLVFGDAELPK